MLAEMMTLLPNHSHGTMQLLRICSCSPIQEEQCRGPPQGRSQIQTQDQIAEIPVRLSGEQRWVLHLTGDNINASCFMVFIL